MNTVPFASRADRFRPSGRGSMITIVVLLAVSVFGATGCGSGGSTDGADVGGTETPEVAESTASTEGSATSATTTPSSTTAPSPATSDSASSGVEGGDGQGAELFPSVATFGIAFDVLNSDLVEEFGYLRIDITGGTAKLPDLGPAGAFATEPGPDVLLGGWVAADGTVSSVAILSPFRSEASLSAVLTLMGVTIDSSQENLDVVSQALQDIDAAGVGGLESLVLDGRGVLFEAVEIDGEPFFWAMVTVDAIEGDAAAAANDLRQAVIDRRDR